MRTTPRPPLPGATRRPPLLRAAILGLGLLGSAVLSGSAASNPTTSTFVPITPCRLIDTRPATQVGSRNTPIAAQETYTATVHGANGACDIPTTATGVSMNVAIVNPTGNSFLTVYPADATNPGTANLNWVTGQAPTPNAVTAALSTDGKLAIFNYAGTVDIAADIVGYYTPGGQGPQGRKGDTGAAGATGQQGDPGTLNRLTDEQIALQQWWQDPGRSATFSVPGLPAGGAFDGTHLWVANPFFGNVARIDPVTGSRTEFTTATGAIAVAFDGTSIWVANADASTVSRLDPATGTELAEYPVVGGASGIAHDGTRIWVTNPGTDTVSRLDPATGTTTTFPVGDSPLGIAFDGTSIWVANANAGTVSRINAVSGATATFAAGAGPNYVAFDGRWVWVTRYPSSVVDRFDPTSGTYTAFPVGAQPLGVAYDGRAIWVANSADNTVSRLDPTSGAEIAHYPTGAAPWGVVFDGTSIWVTNRSGGSVSRIDPR